MRLIGIIIALLLAVGAFFVAMKFLNNNPSPTDSGGVVATATQPDVQSVEVIVAAEDIPVGTVIDQQMVTTQPWPQHLVLDGFITQSLSTSSSFFASTTILIIGGLVALLGTTDKAAEFVREIPFAQATPLLVFEFKIIILLGIFVYAFFRFSWAMRQYTIVAVVVGAMPDPKQFERGEFEREPVAERAGKLTGLAAETFNDGLRAYYFSFAALGWFFSPLVFAVSTGLVVLILYAREFRSDVLHVLRD